MVQMQLRPHPQREDISKTSPISAATGWHLCAAVKGGEDLKLVLSSARNVLADLGQGFLCGSHFTPPVHLQGNGLSFSAQCLHLKG